MGKPKILYETPREKGGSTATIQCSCGELWTLYLWSWAGNGSAKCPYCGTKLSYKEMRGHEWSPEE